MFNSKRLFSVLLPLLIGFLAGCEGKRPPEIARLRFEGQLPVSCLEFSRDGKYLVAGSWGSAFGESAAEQNKILIWDVDRRELKGKLKYAARVSCLAISPKSDLLAVGSGVDMHSDHDLKETPPNSAELLLFDFPSLQLRAKQAGGDMVSSVAFSSDGTSLASSSFSVARPAHVATQGKVAIWETTKLKLRHDLPDIEYSTPVVASSQSRNLFAVTDLVSKGRRGVRKILIKLVEPDEGKVERQIVTDLEPSLAKELNFSADGSLLEATGYLWKVETGNKVDMPAAYWKNFEDVTSATTLGHRAFSSDGKWLTAIINSLGGRSRIPPSVVTWDLKDNKLHTRWESAEGGLGSLAYSSDGKLLAIGTGTGEIVIFDVATK